MFRIAILELLTNSAVDTCCTICEERSHHDLEFDVASEKNLVAQALYAPLSRYRV